MNVKGILLMMSILAVSVAMLTVVAARTFGPHGASAKSGVVTNDDDQGGEDDGCSPDDPPGGDE